MARSRGQPQFEPTDKDRRLVKEMASCGTPQDGIARQIGISAPTLRKHFKDELARAEDEANFRVAQFMFGTIMGAPIPGVPPVTEGPTRAALAMFWAKTRMRWKETNVLEHKDAEVDEDAILNDVDRRISRRAAARRAAGSPEQTE